MARICSRGDTAIATPHVAAATARYSVTCGKLPAIDDIALRVDVERRVDTTEREQRRETEPGAHAAEERSEHRPRHDGNRGQRGDTESARKHRRERLPRPWSDNGLRR